MIPELGLLLLEVIRLSLGHSFKLRQETPYLQGALHLSIPLVFEDTLS